jgi:hypothetical protein
VFLRGKKFNGKKLLRIDALLLFNYKKPLEVKKTYKGNGLLNYGTLVAFWTTLPCTYLSPNKSKVIGS